MIVAVTSLLLQQNVYDVNRHRMQEQPYQFGLGDRRKKEEQIKALSQQKQRLEDRLDSMYGDKLDKLITEEEYRR